MSRERFLSAVQELKGLDVHFSDKGYPKLLQRGLGKARAFFEANP